MVTPPVWGIDCQPSHFGDVSSAFPVVGGIPVSSTVEGGGLVDARHASPGASINLAPDLQHG